MSAEARQNQWAASQEQGLIYYVQEEPLRENIRNDFEDGPIDAVRHGVNFAVLKTDDPSVPIYVREVWDRGTFLPFRPFYEKRIERARSKAAKIVTALSAETSVVIP